MTSAPLQPTAPRQTATPRSLDVIAAFNDAFNDRDADRVLSLMTADCVFDGTAPPDGRRFDGADQVRRAFLDVFEGVREGRFHTEEIVEAAERVVVRWRYDWVDHDGNPGHVRGIDLFRVTRGLVSEKLAYVKG